MLLYSKSRLVNPQKLTELKPRSQQRHLVEKKTTQKDAIKGITSDSQVNSYFPYRWSPASLTFNIHLYLFLYLYITWITINNGTPHLKSPKNQHRRAVLGRPAIKWRAGGGGGERLTRLQSTNPRPKFCLGSSDKTITKKTAHYKQAQNKAWQRASLMMPISDPRDRFFYPHHTPMKGTYLSVQVKHADILIRYARKNFPAPLK